MTSQIYLYIRHNLLNLSRLPLLDSVPAIPLSHNACIKNRRHCAFAAPCQLSGTILCHSPCRRKGPAIYPALRHTFYHAGFYKVLLITALCFAPFLLHAVIIALSKLWHGAPANGSWPSLQCVYWIGTTLSLL